MHPFIPGESTAETILSMLRPDRHYEPEEARKYLDMGIDTVLTNRYQRIADALGF